MELICQTVVDGHPGMSGQLLSQGLAEAPIFDCVIEPPQDAGGVLHGLLVADLGARGPEIGDMRPLIVGGHLEAGSRARRGLLADQRDVLSLQSLLLVARKSTRLNSSNYCAHSMPSSA